MHSFLFSGIWNSDTESFQPYVGAWSHMHCIVASHSSHPNFCFHSFYISVLMLSASHVQETCLCRSFRRELSAVLLQPSSMADLPRWVDRSDVDSKVMLGAFLKYHSEIRQTLHHPELVFQPTWEGHLFAYTHRDPPRLPFPDAVKLPMPLRIPELPCTQRACSRCGVRGGWVFRWYSPYWAKCYNETRRPGAWKAPEPPLADPSYQDEYWEQH